MNKGVIQVYLQWLAMDVIVAKMLLQQLGQVWDTVFLKLTKHTVDGAFGEHCSYRIFLKEGHLILDFFCFLFRFFCFSWLLASVAFGFPGFCGFCGFWLSWLSWLLWLLAFVAFVAFGFLAYPSICLYLSVYIYLSIYLSFVLSFFLAAVLLSLFAFAFPVVCVAETKPNKQASKQASTSCSPLDLVCFWGGRCAPPQPPPPAPQNLHFIPDTRACHEINILR